MTPNFWRMEVPLLEMDKTFRRVTFEEDIKSSISGILNALK